MQEKTIYLTKEFEKKYTYTGNDLIGTYKFKHLTLTDKGVFLEYNIGEEFDGEVITEDFCVVILLKDGDAVLATTQGNQQDVTLITWLETKDGRVVLIRDDGAIICECDGKTLSFSIKDDGDFVLEKKD